MIFGGVRPEFQAAVDAAWGNWRFAAALVAPLVILPLSDRWFRRAWIGVPLATVASWLFAAAGLYHLTAVMSDNAVTAREIGLAADDGVRVTAAWTFVPSLAAAYTAFITWLYTIADSIVQRLRGAPFDHEVAPNVDDGTQQSNEFRLSDPTADPYPELRQTLPRLPAGWGMQLPGYDRDFGYMQFNGMDACDCRIPAELPHTPSWYLAVHVWCGTDGPTDIHRQQLTWLKNNYARLWPDVARTICELHPTIDNMPQIGGAMSDHVSVHLGEHSEDSVELVYDLNLPDEGFRGYFVTVSDEGVTGAFLAE